MLPPAFYHIAQEPGRKTAGEKEEGLYEQKESRTDGWHRASYGGRGGAGTALADTVYVTAGNLNCREGKSTDSAVLGTVPRGTKIQRESDDGTWSRVTVNGNACYVASRYLSSQEPASVLDGKSAAQVHEKNVHVESSKDVFLDKNWEFASFSKINSEAAVYYKNGRADRKGKTVCVNAGHGTRGGSSMKTLCHPDGSPKVTGGTTGAGTVYASAIRPG